MCHSHLIIQTRHIFDIAFEFPILFLLYTPVMDKPFDISNSVHSISLILLRSMGSETEDKKKTNYQPRDFETNQIVGTHPHSQKKNRA